MKTNIKYIVGDIEKKYFHFADILNAPQKFLNFSETPRHDGGAHIEYEGDESDPRWMLDQYKSFMRDASKPHATVFSACQMTNNPWSKHPQKDNFKYVRFGLTKVLLGDGYYGYTDRFNPGHLNVKWYDEFETDLGYPTTDMIKLQNRDVWVRFF